MYETDERNEKNRELPEGEIGGSEEEESSSDQLMEILLNTREQGQMIEQLIENQIRVKDAMIDKLHKELEFYKQDSMDRFVNQLMKAVIKVRTDMGRRMASPQFAEMSARDLQREYTYVYEDLTDLLEQQNIDAYTSEPGDSFDPAIHQAKKTEATEDPSLDKKLKESVSEGYRKGTRVIIPERVIVYKVQR